MKYVNGIKITPTTCWQPGKICKERKYTFLSVQNWHLDVIKLAWALQKCGFFPHFLDGSSPMVLPSLCPLPHFLTQ